MLWDQLQNQTVELGWDFYGPVLLFIALVALAGVQSSGDAPLCLGDELRDRLTAGPNLALIG